MIKKLVWRGKKEGSLSFAGATEKNLTGVVVVVVVVVWVWPCRLFLLLLLLLARAPGAVGNSKQGEKVEYFLRVLFLFVQWPGKKMKTFSAM